MEKPSDRMNIDQVLSHGFLKLADEKTQTQTNNFQNIKNKEL